MPWSPTGRASPGSTTTSSAVTITLPSTGGWHASCSRLSQRPLRRRAEPGILGRAVRFPLDSGIRQFPDLGSGIPTQDNVHEIARRGDPASRVVYVDNDPAAVAHSRQLLLGNELATVIQEPDAAAEAEKLYASTSAAMHARSHEEIVRFFTGFELVEPGLVDQTRWHPDVPGAADYLDRVRFYAGVGRRPPPDPA
jgi:S-adenosyl methyltransferase